VHLTSELAQRWATICTLRAEKRGLTLLIEQLRADLSSETAKTERNNDSTSLLSGEFTGLRNMYDRLRVWAADVTQHNARLQVDLREATARCSKAGVVKLEATVTYLRR
jgi:hypothetical protein